MSPIDVIFFKVSLNYSESEYLPFQEELAIDDFDVMSDSSEINNEGTKETYSSVIENKSTFPISTIKHYNFESREETSKKKYN